MTAPQPQCTRGACMGRGDSPSRNWNALQNALLLRACVMDGQRGEPDRRHPGGTDEHACLVLL